MSTLKYWVRYKNGDPSSSVSWNTFNDTPNNLDPQSGLIVIPQNTCYQVADSGILATDATQSFLEVHAALYTQPTINASEILCLSNLEVTASLPSTISLTLLPSASCFLSASATGSYSVPQWIYHSHYTLQSSSGISITPSFSKTGSHTYTFEAYDICQNLVSSSVLINVLPQPIPEVSSGLITVTAGTSATYYITASNNPITFSASSIPSGFTLDSINGIIYGTASLITGSYSVGISASNNNINFGSSSLLINVATSNINMYFYQASTQDTFPTISISIDGGPVNLVSMSNQYMATSSTYRAHKTLTYTVKLNDGVYYYTSASNGSYYRFAIDTVFSPTIPYILLSGSNMIYSGQISSSETGYPQTAYYTQFSNGTGSIYCNQFGGIGNTLTSGSFFVTASLVGASKLYQGNISIQNFAQSASWTATNVYFQNTITVL